MMLTLMIMKVIGIMMIMFMVMMKIVIPTGIDGDFMILMDDKNGLILVCEGDRCRGGTKSKQSFTRGQRGIVNIDNNNNNYNIIINPIKIKIRFTTIISRL